MGKFIIGTGEHRKTGNKQTSKQQNTDHRNLDEHVQDEISRVMRNGDGENRVVCILGKEDDHASVIVEMMMRRGKGMLRVMQSFLSNLEKLAEEGFADTNEKQDRRKEVQLEQQIIFSPFSRLARL